jgi:hypothetical protein
VAFGPERNYVHISSFDRVCQDAEKDQLQETYERERVWNPARHSHVPSCVDFWFGLRELKNYLEPSLCV